MNSISNTLSSARIREIRTAASMTQQQFADEVGVGKVTVARWESGTRNCRGDYAKRIRSFAFEQTSESVSTTTLFDVGRQDLQALEATSAVEAFRDLLWCECRRLQVPSSEVSIGTREIADGGIDAIVPAMQLRKRSDSFLGEGENYFQIKAGPTWKPWQPSFAKRELLGTQKQLGSVVKRCLSNNGRYILVSFGTDLTPDQRFSAQQNIEEIFAEAGFANAKVDVWGQQELLGHFRRFPFLSLQLSGRENFQFRSWSSWNLSREMSTELELGETQEQFRDEIQRLVRDGDVSHVRVIGEPGLGKTRLVHEALSAKDLSPQVVYVEHAEDFQKSRLYHDLLHPDADYYLILVLDECRPRECAEIWDRLSKHSDRCMVVSLDHDSFHPGDLQFVEIPCPRLDNQQLERIIDSYTSGEGDSRNWADLCSGVPRVAHAIGRNLQTNPDDLLRAPSMQLVWDRFISGYRTLESTGTRQKRTVLRYISLFQRFGFESPVANEGKFIADLVFKNHPDISYARFQEIVDELKKQRILQGKTTLFIAPKLLHIHLWIQLWELYGRSLSISQLLLNMPASLMSWFVQMFPYAGESQVALEQVRNVLGSDGPFIDREFAFSGVGCRFLREFAKASPEHTITCLERVFGQSTPKNLSEFDQGRQNIVWALEHIAVWPSLFCRAARLLRALAESDNAKNSKSASRSFTELFCLAPGRVAPTGAPPEVRLPVLTETLDATSTDTRRLGIKACRVAMDIHSGFRILGREHQGLKTAEMWAPESWGEVHQAMGKVWEALVSSSRKWDTDLKIEANEVLINSALGLIQIPSLSNRVLDTLNALVDDDATDLQQLVQGVSRIRRFLIRLLKKDGDESAILDRLNAIDDKITGTSLSDKVRRTVHLSGREDYYGDDGGDAEQFNHRVKSLAIEAVQSEDDFQDLLSELVCGTNNTVFQFGCEVAQHDDGKYFEDIIERYRTESSSTSALFISGYLATVFDADQRKWERAITDLLREKEFASIIGPVIRNSGITDKVIFKLLERFDSGALSVDCLRSLGYSRHLTALKEPTILAFLERFRLADEIAYALELLAFVYCKKNETRQLPESETIKLLQGFGKSPIRNMDDDSNWSVVAKQFIRQYPSRQIELFEIALDKIADRDCNFDRHSLATPVILSIMQAEPDRCWQTVVARLDSMDDIQRYRLICWLGPGVSFDSSITSGPLTIFPMNAVFEWVAEDPESRAYELTKVVPKSLARDETGVWARELLNRYGQQENVRTGLLAHFFSGGWSGKSSDRYRCERNKARRWLDQETSLRVRQWLEEFIDCMSRNIERAEIDEEREY